MALQRSAKSGARWKAAFGMAGIDSMCKKRGRWF